MYDLESLTSMLATNSLGLVLLFVLFVANFRTLRGKTKESRILLIMFLIVLISTINEVFGDVVNGIEGKAFFYLSYVLNSLSYLLVTVFAYFTLVFLRYHFFRIGNVKEFILMAIPLLGTFVCVIVNLFVPFLFKIDENNIYVRLDGYFITMIMDAISLIHSLSMYVYALKKGKATRFFPYYLFIIPVVFGTAFQTFVSGVSMLWPCFTIGLAGIVASIKSERIFRDELTGLYNRAYFNYVIHNLSRKKKPAMTGIMLDINDFKQINDHFGHDFGDKALVDFAQLLVKSVDRYAAIIRLSGDEFVVLLRSINKEEIRRCVNRINHGFESYNNSKKRPFELFASLGYATYLQGQSPEEFLQDFDENMYKEKKRYHSTQN